MFPHALLFVCLFLLSVLQLAVLQRKHWARNWTDQASVSAASSRWKSITVKPPSRLVHPSIFLYISNLLIKFSQKLQILALPQPLFTLTMPPALFPKVPWPSPACILWELVSNLCRWKDMKAYPSVRLGGCRFNMAVFDRPESEQMDSRSFFWKTPHSSTTATGSPRWRQPSKP